MGMFDTVIYKCPNCEESTLCQTKSGPCRLNTYTIESAPLSILTGFEENGVYWPCEHCGIVPKFKLVPVKGVMYNPQEEEEY